MRRWWSSGAGILALALAGLSCKPATGPNDDNSPSSIVFPLSNVSYAAQVQPLFNQACALGGCHDDASAQRNLRLTSYGSWNAGIVIPGEPQNSILVVRIEGRLGERMPPGGYPLNQNQINGLRAWIAEGAKNN
jgi:hypothetical protein